MCPLSSDLVSISAHLSTLSICCRLPDLGSTFIFPLESESSVQLYFGNLHVGALWVSQTSCSQRDLWILCPLPFLTHTQTLASVVFSISVQFTSPHPYTTVPDCILFYFSPRHISICLLFPSLLPPLYPGHCPSLPGWLVCPDLVLCFNVFWFLSIWVPNSSRLLPS